MNTTLEGLKPLIEMVAEISMLKQKACDLEKERDYLRERLAYLEKVIVERNVANPELVEKYRPPEEF